MTGISSGGGGGYDYVEASYPADPDEGESLYHTGENRAFVYNGSAWVEQTVTAHSQLSGVNEGDHRSDQRVSDLAPVQNRYTDAEAESAAPVQKVNGRTGAVTGLFEASDYTPEADTHDRYTDAEAESAAPVQKVNGRTGAVTGLLEASDYNPEADTHSPPSQTQSAGEGTARVQIDGSLTGGGNPWVVINRFELSMGTGGAYPSVTFADGTEYKADDTNGGTVVKSFDQPKLLYSFGLPNEGNTLEFDIVVGKSHNHPI